MKFISSQDLNQIVSKTVADNNLKCVGIQNERENIERLLETNQKYAQLIMDLRLYRANETGDMISLTKCARRKNGSNLGYVIQSWLRDRNTIEFLRLWEKENNSFKFDDDAAQKLIERTHESSFVLTAKIWIKETNAIGLQSKQGANGGTFAAEQIAVDFITWLYPKKRYELMKLILNRTMMIHDKLIVL